MRRTNCSRDVLMPRTAESRNDFKANDVNPITQCVLASVQRLWVMTADPLARSLASLPRDRRKLVECDFEVTKNRLLGPKTLLRLTRRIDSTWGKTVVYRHEAVVEHNNSETIGDSSSESSR